MSNFQDYYRSIFATFGYPLSPRSAIPESVLIRAETRLEIRVPLALRDYYLVAGHERRFNQPLERLLSPAEWIVAKKRLVFMVENQAVCWWGVSIRNPESLDPPASQSFDGPDDEGMQWSSQNRKCSMFLAVMLHYQAVNGGFRFINMEPAPKNVRRILDQDWTYHGKIADQRAYSKDQKAVFLSRSWEGPILYTDAKNRNGLQEIRDELGIRPEPELDLDNIEFDHDRLIKTTVDATRNAMRQDNLDFYHAFFHVRDFMNGVPECEAWLEKVGLDKIMRQTEKEILGKVGSR